MGVIRREKNKNYTVMSNVHLFDKEISLKARGLLCTVFALPDNWEYSVNGLVALCKESETAVKSCMNELKEHGYLIVTKERNLKGLFEYVYTFYENPSLDNPHMEEPQTENPPLENPPMDNLNVESPQVENVGLLNTNISNTKQSITKKQNTNGLNTTKEQTKPRKKTTQIYYPNDELLNQTFLDYIAMRKQIKKPMTERAIDLAMKKLQELATPKNSFSMDNDLAIKILEQSIMSCWQGLFPLKEEHHSNNKKNDFDEWKELYARYEQVGNN